MTDSRKPVFTPPVVVLVHGIAAHRMLMWPMANRLRNRFGFRSRTWGYRSLFSSIDTHADHFASYWMEQFIDEPCVHVVAHSMGAIVVRAALGRHRFDNIGRLVLLSPPNRGTPVARVVSRLIGGMVPPTRQLSDDRESYVNRLSDLEGIEVGIIAAKHDWLVPLSSTFLPTERAHICVSAIHSSLLVSRQVSELIANYLRHGRFEGAVDS